MIISNTMIYDVLDVSKVIKESIESRKGSKYSSKEIAVVYDRRQD